MQLILNTLIFGMNPQQAIEAPRFATDSAVNSFYPHTHYPGQLSLEPGFSEETVAKLAAMGHKPNPSAVCGMGATVARRDPSTGVPEHRRRPPPSLLRHRLVAQRKIPSPSQGGRLEPAPCLMRGWG